MQGEASHRLEVDRERKLLIVTALSLLSPEDSAWVGEELRAAILTFGADIGQHVTLYDGSALPSLPTATVDLMQRTWDHAAVRELWARKVAFVVKTATARMQIKRLQQVRPDMRVFDDRESAVAWLLEP